MSEPIKYVVDPLAPFPKRWKDRHGAFKVMAGPVDGYLMVRRPGCLPYVLHVTEILNSANRPHPHGPFECLEPTKRVKLVTVA